MFCFILVVYFFLKKKFVHSELARQAGAKGHARAIPGHGTLHAAQTRLATVIQRFGTGGSYRMARPCCLRRKKKFTPAIWHGWTVPHGTTVPPATGFLRVISFFFPSFSCFFLTSSLSTKSKTLASPPCYPPPHSNLHPFSSIFPPKLCISFINLHFSPLTPSNLLNFSSPIFHFLFLKP